MADQQPVPALVVKDIVTFRDRDTGELIPKSQIEENMLWIDRILKLLEEGRTVHREALKETKNDYWEAGKRSNAFQGEGCSELWDQLAESKVVCALDLLCPPAKDKGAMYANEKRVSIMIGQASEYMFKNIVDIWTSRYEIGQRSETHVKVYFPYHLWQRVEELAAKVSVMNVGPHHFKGSLCLEARTKLERLGRQVQQWQLECNGQALPELSKDEMAELNNAAKGSFEEKFAIEQQVQQIDKDGSSPEVQCALAFLWKHEIKQMMETRTYKLFSLINDTTQRTSFTLGMFQLFGIIINAAEEAKDCVLCCEGAEKHSYPGSPLFYDTNLGDNFLTLDPPFTLNMNENKVNNNDAVVYGWRYHTDFKTGVRLEKAGLCFLQHLSSKKHPFNLLSLAQLVKPKMSNFSTKIACMQADKDSSTSASDFQVARIACSIYGSVNI